MEMSFAAPREDHDTQGTLVDLLVETHGDCQGRNQLLGRLKRELRSHAAAQERHFCAPLLQEVEFDKLDIAQEGRR
jgi:hypothetical protein